MRRSDTPDESKHVDAVGYRRPPVNRRFKPGQSGNPKGRPKARKNFKTIFAELLNGKLKARDKSGRIRIITRQEAMIEIMINKALAGDPKAFEKVVQVADKFGVFNMEPPESSMDIQKRLQESILELDRRVARYRKQPSEEQSQQEMRNDGPAQGNSNAK
jgi:hypothetical protein